MTIQPLNIFGQMFEKIFKSNLKPVKEEADDKSRQQSTDTNSHQEEPVWSSAYKDKYEFS